MINPVKNNIRKYFIKNRDEYINIALQYLEYCGRDNEVWLPIDCVDDYCISRDVKVSEIKDSIANGWFSEDENYFSIYTDKNGNNLLLSSNKMTDYLAIIDEVIDWLMDSNGDLPSDLWSIVNAKN